MTKTLSERAEDNVREANAVAADVKVFREKTLDAYPGFSYAKLQADQPEVYAKLRAVEAKLDSAVGKSIFFLIKLNEKWWDLLYQGLVQQEQFGAEIARMKRIYDMGRAH